MSPRDMLATKPFFRRGFGPLYQLGRRNQGETRGEANWHACQLGMRHSKHTKSIGKALEGLCGACHNVREADWKKSAFSKNWGEGEGVRGSLAMLLRRLPWRLDSFEERDNPMGTGRTQGAEMIIKKAKAGRYR